MLVNDTHRETVLKIITYPVVFILACFTWYLTKGAII